MINFGNVTGEEINKHNLNCSETFDHPYIILLTDQSSSERTIALLTLINHEPGVDKMYLYEKDQYEAKSQLLFNGIEIVCS